MDRRQMIQHLKETDPKEIRRLMDTADRVRREFVGDAVHLRGLVEFSNVCRRACHYCGIRSTNHSVNRYRMTADEIVKCVETASELGLGTVVLQSGEDPNLDIDRLAALIRRIKSEYNPAVTLSIGERTYQELKQLKTAGADRYLLRFETTNNTLYHRYHPPWRSGSADRFTILKWLDELGYETGSGVMIGLPGQTYDDLCNDLEMFQKLNLDMIGIGPFIPHPDTPLTATNNVTVDSNLVPNTPEMTLKALALTRIVCRDINIPSTTALETLKRRSGFESGLSSGANVVMPNVTPLKYRKLYSIYPTKACITEDARELVHRLKENLAVMGRQLGTGPGDSRHFQVKNSRAPALSTGEEEGKLHEGA